MLSQVYTCTCEKAALSYALTYGWPVFPVAGKQPLTPRGFYNATTDGDQIQRWWRQWPAANIGIPTGETTGLVVIDVDPRHGGLVALEELQHQFESLPTTRTTRTGGGGLHLWYACPQGGGQPIKNATNLGSFSGIDLRGTGGYVVVPPSRHASGNCYLWLREETIAPLPGFLIDLARPTSPALQGKQLSPRREKRDGRFSPKDGNYWLQQALQKAVPGTRNTTGFWLACQLRDNGVGFLNATQLMQRYAATVAGRGSQLYTEREALRSLSSAYSTPPRAPARCVSTRPGQLA
jgi:hypothetical protein